MGMFPQLREMRRRLAEHGSARLRLLLTCGALAAGIAVFSVVRTSQRGLVPLDSNTAFTTQQFREAQTAFRAAGLNGAKWDGGTIVVPTASAADYRRVWPAGRGNSSRAHWADAWQSANDRLSQFSGSRERDAARDISRAQVIAERLEALPDIESADVVWDEVASTGWRTPPRVRATVYLQAAPGCVIGPDIVDAVQRAVAGSKANLSVADVCIMDQTRGITYDGASHDTHVAQLVALYRGRLEAELAHLPGARVTIHSESVRPRSAVVHADIGSPTSAGSDSVPIVVSIGIPDASIRSLAGLSAGSMEGAGAERRREVYRSVEQHLQHSIRSKARLLLPAGLSLEAPERVLVETLPSPGSPSPPTTTPPQLVIPEWLQQNYLLVGAVLCGVGALWMLRPVRVTATPSPVDATDLAAEPVVRSEATTKAEQPSSGEERAHLRLREPSLPLTPRTRGPQDVRPASPPQDGPVAASLAPEPVHSAPPAMEDRPHAEPVESPVITLPSPAAAAPSSPRTDVLQSALQRLQGRGVEHHSTPTVQEPRHAASSLRIVAPAEPPEPAAVEPLPPWTDLESLAGLPPEPLRALTTAVEVAQWSQALFGSSTRLQAQILSHLPPAEAQQLTRELRSGRPVRLRDIDAAQEAIRLAWEALRQNLPLESEPPAQIAVRRTAA